MDIVVAGNKAIIDKELVEYLEEESSKKKDVINKDPAEYLDKKNGENVYNSKIIDIGIEGGYKNKRVRIILI